MDNRIGIIGVGKLGLAYALVFENAGWNVLASSYKKDYVEELNQKKIDSTEPQIAEMLANSKNINFTVNNHDVIDHADIWYVMVATPSNDDGSYDISSVKDVAQDILDHPSDVSGKILLVGCTVNPGDCDNLQQMLSVRGVKVAFCPTFISQGSVVYEIINPLMHIIGTPDEDVYQTVKKVMASLSPDMDYNLIYKSERESAEILKIAGNCFSILKITFMNMLGQIMIERNLAQDLEISTKVMNRDEAHRPWRFGFGYGGPCYPRDNRAMIHFAESAGRSYPLGEVCDQFNNDHVEYIADYLIKHNTDSKPFYFKYLSYKAGVKIYSESHPFEICKKLLELGHSVVVKDSIHVDMDAIKELQYLHGDNKITVVPDVSERFYEVLPSVVALAGTKYAIKIPGPDGSLMFVTKTGPDGIEPIIYNTMYEALEQAKVYQGQGIVIEYANG